MGRNMVSKRLVCMPSLLSNNALISVIDILVVVESVVLELSLYGG